MLSDYISTPSYLCLTDGFSTIGLFCDCSISTLLKQQSQKKAIKKTPSLL